MAVRFFRWFKRIPYRNTTEEVGNIYMYDGFSEGGAGTDPPGAIRSIEGQILDGEKAIHGTLVSFVRVESGLVRPPRGAEKYPVPGLIDYTRELVPSEPGTRINSAGFRQPEDCVLVQRRISNRGWLRKYWHGCLPELQSGATLAYRWEWTADVQADALGIIQSLDELQESGVTPTYRLTNSRGQRPGESGGLSGPWQVSARAVYHELKY